MARLGVFSVGLLCVCLAGHAEDARDSTPLTFWPLPLSAPVLPLGSRAPSVTETVRGTSEPSGRRQDVQQAQSREALSKAVAEQLDAIEAERARSGERSPELIALLASLASSYEQLGDYRSADAALEQAIDLARVNFGLHSLEQADVVASLVATRQTSGDFGGAAEKRRYLRELVSRNFYDPRVVGILTEIAEQEMDSARRLVGVPAPFPIGFSAVAADPLGIGPPTPSLVALHAAQSDYVAAIQAAVRTHTGNTADVFALEDALSNTVYFELAHPEILGAAGGHSPGRGMGPASWYPTLGFKGGLILRHKALDSMSFRRSPVDVAMDLLALADWYLVFGSYEGVTAGGTKSYGPALDTYRMARDLLVKSDVAPEQIDEILSPEIPPAVPVLPETIAGGVEDRIARGYVDASVEITRFGDVKRVVILGRSPGVTKDVEQDLRHYVSSRTYRPRFVNGEQPRFDRFAARFYFD